MTRTAKRPIDILKDKRWVAYIPATGYDKKNGYRVSFVIEGEAFHRPTGGGDVEPWYWGHDYKKARACADKYNESLGISKLEAAKIVARSMARGMGRECDDDNEGGA